MRSFFDHVVTTASLVTRAKTGEDSDGNDILGETTVSVPAVFAPAGSVESVAGRDLVIDSDTFYLAAAAGLSPDAFGAIDYQGQRFEINGSPQLWVSPFSGQTAGWAVPVKRVSG